MAYILSHTVLGFCWWDLPALIVLISVAVGFAVKHRKLKEDEKELKEQLEVIK